MIDNKKIIDLQTNSPKKYKFFLFKKNTIFINFTIYFVFLIGLVFLISGAVTNFTELYIVTIIAFAYGAILMYILSYSKRKKNNYFNSKVNFKNLYETFLIDNKLITSSVEENFASIDENLNDQINLRSHNMEQSALIQKDCDAVDFEIKNIKTSLSISNWDCLLKNNIFKKYKFQQLIFTQFIDNKEQYYLFNSNFEVSEKIGTLGLVPEIKNCYCYTNQKVNFELVQKLINLIDIFKSKNLNLEICIQNNTIKFIVNVKKPFLNLIAKEMEYSSDFVMLEDNSKTSSILEFIFNSLIHFSK